jgi:hypothetical protein
MLRGLIFVACTALTMTVAATAAHAAKAKNKMAEATDAFRAGKFARAAELFSGLLVTLPAADRGGPVEREAREKLVLSLYADKQTDAAMAEYNELLRRFADHRFDPDRVSPQTIAFFERSKPAAPASVQTAPPPPPQTVVAAPASAPTPELQPRAITSAPEVQPAPEKRWHWYYLTPLGIGQFLAGSPVRGALLLVLQVGLVTLNAVAYALLMRQVRSDGTVESLARAAPLQTMTNVAFFGWIGALVLGTIDGAFLEP